MCSWCETKRKQPGDEGKNTYEREEILMNILIYEWRAYNYKDIICTFRTFGVQLDFISALDENEADGNVVTSNASDSSFIKYKLKNYDEDPIFEKLLSECLLKKDYDFVFTVNYFAAIARVCRAHKVKYVSWTCDSPLISMYHETVFSDYNYIFTFDKTNFLEFRGMGVKHIWYLPLAVDTNRLDDVLQKDKEGSLLGAAHEKQPVKDVRRKEDVLSGRMPHDITFVGSLYERNTYDKLEKILPDYLRGYFDACIQAQLSISGGNILEEMLTPNVLSEVSGYFKLDKSDDSFSDLGLIFQTTVLGFKVAAEQRKRALLALSKKFDVTVYSNSDFSKFDRIRCLGSVDYWTEMPHVFFDSKINLNFTIPNIKSGIPLRVWDVLGSGGFLLTNYQAEIPYYFKDGEDLVCFDDEKDLEKKVSYYMEHEDERREIAKNGYRKVKENHSYRARVEEMLSYVE